MAFDDPLLTVGVAGLPIQPEGPRATGKMAAEAALKKAGRTNSPDYFYMSAPPGAEEYYLKGITEVIGRVPFFGGSAADNAIAGNWTVYTDEYQAPDGVSVAFFYCDKPFANKFTGAYTETTNYGVITKMDGDRTIVEIDGEPACKRYREWTGVSGEAVSGGNLLVTCVTAPLGVKDRLGDLIAIRHPMNGNDDGSMSKAIGNQLTCVFVDHGLLRKDEGDEVEAVFGPDGPYNVNFIRVNAQQRFYDKLAGVTEPEQKRKIIGEEFIRVFEEEAKKIGAVDYLVQGTIYPDVIESGLGDSATIKSHHNVGGLPDFVDFKEIVEPLRME